MLVLLRPLRKIPGGASLQSRAPSPQARAASLGVLGPQIWFQQTLPWEGWRASGPPSTSSSPRPRECAQRHHLYHPREGGPCKEVGEASSESPRPCLLNPPGVLLSQLTSDLPPLDGLLTYSGCRLHSMGSFLIPLRASLSKSLMLKREKENESSTKISLTASWCP